MYHIRVKQVSRVSCRVIKQVTWHDTFIKQVSRVVSCYLFNKRVVFVFRFLTRLIIVSYSCLSIIVSCQNRVDTNTRIASPRYICEASLSAKGFWIVKKNIVKKNWQYGYIIFWFWEGSKIQNLLGKKKWKEIFNWKNKHIRKCNYFYIRRMNKKVRASNQTKVSEAIFNYI